jgi:predicted DNA-binding protein YlxM (UPF0122 family)
MQSTSIAQLERLYKVGWSLQEVADMTGIPKSTIYGRLRGRVEMRERGGNMRYPSHRDMTMTIFLYVNMELSMHEVARRMSINQSTVRERLLNAGVTPRPRAVGIRLAFKQKPMSMRRPSADKIPMSR